jgi:hypothetical protein
LPIRLSPSTPSERVGLALGQRNAVSDGISIRQKVSIDDTHGFLIYDKIKKRIVFIDLWAF